MVETPVIAGARKLPDFEEYYMNIAFAVRQRANCKGYKVGAVLVVKNRIVSTGYNGVPEGMKNCLDGGCDRCSRTSLQAGSKGWKYQTLATRVGCTRRSLPRRSPLS